MAVHVRPLPQTDLDPLFALPRRIYAGDPAWVPPLEVWERRRLAPTNAFFRSAEIRLFVAERDGEVVGSISILKDKNFVAKDGRKVAWFGWFECEDNATTAQALFDAVREVARGWGADAIRGPRNLTRFEYVGLTVEGYDRLPPMLQDHHPPYYQALFEAAGLQPHHDVLAYETDLLDADGRPRSLPAPLADKAAACNVPGLVCRRARWRSIQQDLSDVHTVLNAAYASVPDIQPMPRATWMSLGRAILVFGSTELIQLAYVGDKPVAFAVCMPEVNEALVKADGKLLPMGGLRFMMGFRHIRTAGFKLIGVDPAFRGTGVHAKIIANIVDGARRAGYTRMDGSVIDERNKPMRAVVEGAGMTVYRRYRFFEDGLS